MSDAALRTLLSKAVQQLRDASDLTIDEVIGLVGLERMPESLRSPEACYSLGIIAGAAAALGATPQEMLEEHELLTAPARG